MHIKYLLPTATFLVFFLSCADQNNKKSDKEKGNTVNPKKDILAENLDTTISPAADFFDYANGGWIKKNPIPNDQSSWGIGNLVVEENLKRLKDISEKASSSKAANSTNEQKIGDFWSTAMDSAEIEKLGLTPLQVQLDKINSITDSKSLVATVAELKNLGSSTLFSDFVSQDDKNSDAMAYKLWQGGIGLPERDYYFNTDPTTANIRKEYVKYIARILSMSGEDSSKTSATAKNIMALETKLAKASRKLEDLRDDYKNYNKMAVADLTKLSGIIDWASFFRISGVKNIDSVIVGQPEFFRVLDKELKTTTIRVWKNYLKFNLINDFSGALPDKFGIEAFNFNKLFSGAKERKPRWKRVMQVENNLLGEPLGQLYVKEFFSEKAKERYSNMVEAIRTAFKARMNQLTWMSDETKQKAFLKLAAMKKKVGYPDKWKDFSAMQISRESYVQNLMNANRWWHNYQVNKLGKPVDRSEWDMTPQTYNAYYNSSNNEIVLPAGIFTVPGYKDEELDDALVYGYAAASTIGHEITHGFDDQGRKYDAKGNLSKWWTDKDSVEFSKRADVIIKQFSKYEPVKGFHINGKATQGENIADLGGILLGLDAFKKTDQYKKNEKINGLTPLQRYFLGYALGWLGHQREEVLRNQIMTDVHAPIKWRVNGPFVDVDEFYITFIIKTGDKMYVPDSLRVRIW
jgi:putative endopeptidase